MNSKPQRNAFQCPELLAQWYCLNGATCFSLSIDESVFYNCLCQDGFYGARCDFKHATSSRSQDAENQTLSSSSTLSTTDELAHDFIAVSDESTKSLFETHNRGLANRRYSNQERTGVRESQALIILFYSSSLILMIAFICLIMRLLRRNSTLNEINQEDHSQRSSRGTIKGIQAIGHPANGTVTHMMLESSHTVVGRHRALGLNQSHELTMPKADLARDVTTKGLAPNCTRQRCNPASPFQRANDSLRRHAIINKDGLERIPFTFADELHDSDGLGGMAAQREQRKDQNRYIFMQMAIIKRPGDMRRTLILENNCATDCEILQSLEV